MKILLVQFRTDQSAPHEQQCVLRHAGLGAEELVVLQPLVAPETIAQFQAADFDGIIIGGSGEFNLPHRTPRVVDAITAVRPLIDDALKDEQPLLGLCFGHQLLAEHLGGIVAKMEGDPAVGTFDVSITAEGARDPLHRALPKVFAAQHGHKDSVAVLPRGATVLATTPHDPHASYRIGKRTYGVQYHGELDQEDLLFRMRLYPSYVAGKTEEELRAQFRPTPEAPNLLRNFCVIARDYRAASHLAVSSVTAHTTR